AAYIYICYNIITMRLQELSRDVLAGAAGTALLLGPTACSSDMPEFKQPDGTCATAMGNAGVGGETVRQEYSFTIHIGLEGEDEERVVVCNATERPVDQADVARLVGYFAGTSSVEGPIPSNSLRIALKTKDESEPNWVTA